jgi:DNA-binding HxlR family transcriptional regulator
MRSLILQRVAAREHSRHRRNLETTVTSRSTAAAGAHSPARYHGGVTERPDLTPLAQALERVGDRWMLLLVRALLDGPCRFNDLQEILPGIAPNILSERLKRLEREALVVGRPYSTRPLRLAYELTSTGLELAGSLRMLASWGARHSGGKTDPPRHTTCGTPMEARWYCPTCDRNVEENEDPELQFF